MNILYIGGGFVGTCSAAVAVDSGHTVLVYDIDKTKVEKLGSNDHAQIESCLYEDGLADMLIRNKEQISFTDDYSKVETFLEDCDAIFMCIQTPEIGETGESDLKYYNMAADTLATALKARNKGAQTKYTVIVNKSTVPVDMVNHTAEMMDKAGVENYGVVSNPEFLVEGKAIQGSIKPDRVVVGAWNEKDFEIMREVYQRFYVAPTVQYIEVNPKEAAAGKLLANFYLFAKLSLCFDVIGRTSEAFDDVSFENLRTVLMSESRISNWGFYDSMYAGGSCFIKDARSLAHQLEDKGKNPGLVREVYDANKRQLTDYINRAETEAGIDWNGKTVALLGTAFKRDTNDTRNSPSIELAKHIGLKGGILRVYDPQAMPMFEWEFPATDKLIYTESVEDSLKDSDVVILSTDWPAFAHIADTLMNLPKKPIILDGRRMLQQKYDELRDAGFTILAVGSPLIMSS